MAHSPLAKKTKEMLDAGVNYSELARFIVTAGLQGSPADLIEAIAVGMQGAHEYGASVYKDKGVKPIKPKFEIYFTHFQPFDRYVELVINNGEYIANALLLDKPLGYGESVSRVEMVKVAKVDKSAQHSSTPTPIASWSARNWELRPLTPEHKAVYSAVREFLENAPKTRFQS